MIAHTSGSIERAARLVHLLTLIIGFIVLIAAIADQPAIRSGADIADYITQLIDRLILVLGRPAAPQASLSSDRDHRAAPGTE